MTDSELIIYAVVAAVICYRLWSVLGKTNGDEKARASAKIIPPMQKEQKPSIGKPVIIEAKPVEIELEQVPAHLQADYNLAKKIDPAFSLKKFTKGAEGAFEMVIKAYSDGKKEPLKFLLSPEVYTNFETQIDQRKNAGQEVHHSVYSMEDPKILDIELSGSVCQVLVQFVSEQFNYIKDSNGQVIEGSVNELEHVTDTWTFERDLASKKPNWVVAGIQSN